MVCPLTLSAVTGGAGEGVVPSAGNPTARDCRRPVTAPHGCVMELYETRLEHPPVVAAQDLCRFLDCEFAAQRRGELRQVGVARQSARTGQAALVGADADMVDTNGIDHAGNAV